MRKCPTRWLQVFGVGLVMYDFAGHFLELCVGHHGWKESAHDACRVVSDKGVVVLGGNSHVIAFSCHITSNEVFF